MTEKKSGGARPGSGRKKGVRTVDPQKEAITRAVTLPLYLWQEIDRKCEEKNLTRAKFFRALVEKKLGEKE